MRDTRKTFRGDWLAEVGHPWHPVEKKTPEVLEQTKRGLNLGPLLVWTVLFLLLGSLLLFLWPGDSQAEMKKTVQVTEKSQDRKDNSGHAKLYREAGKTYDVSWKLLAAVGWLETRHGTDKTAGVYAGLNYADCCAGWMQICVVEGCGNVFGTYGVDGNKNGNVSPYEPADSIYTAARILRSLEDNLGWQPDLILASYNAGPGAVSKYNGVPPYPETKNYVAQGLSILRSI